MGQVAKDKVPQTLNQVPAHYWKLSSGLIQNVPTFLYIFPITHNGEIKAVGELGTLTPLEKHEQEYLNLSKDTLGIALNSAQSREQISELLQKNSIANRGAPSPARRIASQ